MFKSGQSNHAFIYVSAFIIAGALLFVLGHFLSSKSPAPITYGFGRAAKTSEIKALDIDVSPDGKGLPAGAGNIKSGQLIYQQKCIACHATGEVILTETIKKWPYATTIFDYTRRAMPFNAPGSLTDQEVYHLTAYLLYANQIIPAGTVITEHNLPKIKMPARNKYVPDDREGGPELK